MNSGFDEGRVGQVDPLVNLGQDFDWPTLSDRLGEAEDNPSHDAEDLEVLGKVLDLLLDDVHDARINLKRVGLNLIALGWVLNPGRFDGAPSVRKLARQCGVSAAALADATGQISRLIGWRNRQQSHAWNWRPGPETRTRKGGR